MLICDTDFAEIIEMQFYSLIKSLDKAVISNKYPSPVQMFFGPYISPRSTIA